MKSLTSKVLSVLVVIMLIVGSIVTAVSYMQNNARYEAEFRDDATSLSTQMSVILQEPVYVYDSAVITSIIDSFIDQPIVVDLKVKDQRGKLLSESKGSGKSDERREVTLTWEGKTIGTVEIDLTHEPMHEKISAAVQSSLVTVAVISLLIGIAVIIALNKLVLRPLSEVNKTLGDIADGGGDLTSSIEVTTRDEIGQLGNSFNSFIQTVRDIVKDMAGAAYQLEEVSETVREIKDKTISSTAQQCTLTEGSVVNIQQLDAATQEIARNTESTVAMANKATEVSQQGQAAIETNIDGITELVANLEQTSEEVSSLKDASDNIGRVLDVIKGIAEQTNLLALNAAIEAARAGESGRGFAVVADEVRALASKTHDSTTEIESIIVQLQTQADASYKATQASKNMVTETTEQARGAGEALENIRNEMTSINDMVTMISSACEEQANVTNVVNGDMEQLNLSSGQLTQDSQQLEDATEQLIQVGEKMVVQINRFKY